MGRRKGFCRRAGACVLAVTISLSTVPRVSAREAVLGTVVFNGTAYSATPTTEWVKIEATRPLVSGDRLKTDKDASLVADFSQLGLIGLYGDSEMSVIEEGEDIVVDAKRGKVAFYIAPKSRIKLHAGSAVVVGSDHKSEGYVQFHEHGAPELVVESEDVNVVVANGPKIFVRGDHVVLNDTLEQAPVTAETTDERKAGVMEEPKKKGGLSPLAWTAIAGAVAAVGIGVGVGVAGGGGGGGGGDSNGSE